MCKASRAKTFRWGGSECPEDRRPAGGLVHLCKGLWGEPGETQEDQRALSASVASLDYSVSVMSLTPFRSRAMGMLMYFFKSHSGWIQEAKLRMGQEYGSKASQEATV